MISTSIEIDILLLAEHAEVHNGKLFLMGGGWDTIGMPEPGLSSHFTVVLVLYVAWAAANVEHTYTLRVEDDEGAPLYSQSRAIRVGRPADLPEGTAQQVKICAPITLIFPTPGRYSVVAHVAGQQKRKPFRVRGATAFGGRNQFLPACVNVAMAQIARAAQLPTYRHTRHCALYNSRQVAYSTTI